MEPVSAGQPVSAVLTAVSTRPSRPAIVWKTNSVGVSPLKKLSSTKPFASGSFWARAKWGRERRSKPSGGRFPDMAWTQGAVFELPPA